MTQVIDSGVIEQRFVLSSPFFITKVIDFFLQSIKVILSMCVAFLEM